MHRFLLLLSVLGVLILASCRAPGGIQILNSNDKTVGSIDVQGPRTATILDADGEIRGKVRGNVIRDAAGKNIGMVSENDGSVVINDNQGNAVGNVQGMDCYGKGQEKLGSISEEVDADIAAAACLIFFLQ